MKALRQATAALALAGAAVAAYLTWVHYAGLQPFCVGNGGGCERVQSSEYARFVGIPVAVVGLGGYLEVAEIEAICQWCVVSALIMTALAGVSVARLLRVDR
jgi:uncharacterized membrane protein